MPYKNKWNNFQTETVIRRKLCLTKRTKYLIKSKTDSTKYIL